MSTTGLLASNFALILLGVLLRRHGGFGEDFWRGLERFVYYVLFPALLFGALARSTWEFSAAAALIQTGVAFMAAGIALGYLGRFLFAVPPASFASGFQCAFRFNSYIGFAVIGGLFGQEGVAAFGLLTGFMVIMANVASVWALAHHADSRWLPELVRNPLLVSTFAWLAWALLGLPLPEVAGAMLDFLGQAALPMGLISVGTGLRLMGLGRFKGFSAYLTVVKLVIVPAIAYAVAQALGLSGVYLAAALLLAALPAASSAYILTVQMGGDGRLVASLITLHLVVAVLTLPLWLGLVGDV